MARKHLGTPPRHLPLQEGRAATLNFRKSVGAERVMNRKNQKNLWTLPRHLPLREGGVASTMTRSGAYTCWHGTIWPILRLGTGKRSSLTPSRFFLPPGIMAGQRHYGCCTACSCVGMNIPEESQNM